MAVMTVSAAGSRCPPGHAQSRLPFAVSLKPVETPPHCKPACQQSGLEGLMLLVAEQKRMTRISRSGSGRALSCQSFQTWEHAAA